MVPCNPLYECRQGHLLMKSTGTFMMVDVLHLMLFHNRNFMTTEYKSVIDFLMETPTIDRNKIPRTMINLRPTNPNSPFAIAEKTLLDIQKANSHPVVVAIVYDCNHDVFNLICGNVAQMNNASAHYIWEFYLTNDSSQSPFYEAIDNLICKINTANYITTGVYEPDETLWKQNYTNIKNLLDSTVRQTVLNFTVPRDEKVIIEALARQAKIQVNEKIASEVDEVVPAIRPSPPPSEQATGRRSASDSDEPAANSRSQGNGRDKLKGKK
jgi:hypothetical protein